jgi:hypothetical protein
VIPAVESTEPLATSVAVPAAVPAEAAATNGETPATETPVTKSEKRKSSLPWLSKKEKPVTSDDEGEKPLSPFAKVRATLRGKSPKAPEKAPEKAAEEPASEAATEPAAAEAPAVEATPAPVEEPVAAEPIQAATAQVSATA